MTENAFLTNKQRANDLKKANKYLGNPITILQLSDCDRHFKQIEDCFSANDRNKYAGNKRMEMKETIQKLCELDNNPIVLTDDDRKYDSDQQATSERFKRANKYLGNPITILQLSKCDENFKQIEDCFSANDGNKYAKNKRMKLAMAFKTMLLYGGKDAVEKQTKRNFLKLFKWIAWATNLIKN
ncbi:hypothetical protein HpCOL3_03580 [Helicobacter pylori]